MFCVFNLQKLTLPALSLRRDLEFGLSNNLRSANIMGTLEDGLKIILHCEMAMNLEPEVECYSLNMKCSHPGWFAVCLAPDGGPVLEN